MLLPLPLSVCQQVHDMKVSSFSLLSINCYFLQEKRPQKIKHRNPEPPEKPRMPIPDTPGKHLKREGRVGIEVEMEGSILLLCCKITPPTPQVYARAELCRSSKQHAGHKREG